MCKSLNMLRDLTSRELHRIPRLYIIIVLKIRHFQYVAIGAIQLLLTYVLFVIQLESVRLLLELGADPFVEDAHYRNAFYYVFFGAHIREGTMSLVDQPSGRYCYYHLSRLHTFVYIFKEASPSFYVSSRTRMVRLY